MRLLAEQAARVAYEATCALANTVGVDFSVGWEHFQDKSRIIDAAKFIIANPNAGDEGEHEAWLAARKLDGWHYGETVDRAHKLHPAIVPFDELPVADRRRDRLFRAVVLALGTEG